MLFEMRVRDARELSRGRGQRCAVGMARPGLWSSSSSSSSCGVIGRLRKLHRDLTQIFGNFPGCPETLRRPAEGSVATAAVVCGLRVFLYVHRISGSCAPRTLLTQLVCPEIHNRFQCISTRCNIII